VTELATFDVRNLDGYRVVIAAGEIDISNARDFRRALQDAAPAKTEALIVSLSAVTYMDSNALAVLLETSRRFGVSRRQLRIVCPPESSCGTLVRIAGLHKVFPMFDTIEIACNGL
jgi:anti-sigma B factor antagonist